MIAAAFEQDVSLAFIDDGVYQLKKGQNTDGIATKNFTKTFGALEMYDVEKLYVEKESLEERGLLVKHDLSVDVEVLASSDLKKLFNESEVFFNF